MTVFYPFYEELGNLAKDAQNSFSNGNFSLWYNKLIPNNGHKSRSNKNDSWTACDNKGDKDKKIGFYKNIYKKITSGPAIKKVLETKHCRQMHFAEQMQKRGYNICCFTGTLKTALVTGIGEAHPSETSIVLDHTTGIPYIPSSGIKGMVRFAHSKNLLFDDNGQFTDTFVIQGKNRNDELIEILDEKNYGTCIPLFFGGDVRTADGNKAEILKGKIIFMDAYPVNVPKLHEDIINPHYSKYYDDNNEPPGDWHDPVPVKFLVVAPKTEFIFRFLLDPNTVQYMEQFEEAVKRALETEGIGAKTAVGYGRFESLSTSVPESVNKAYQEYLKNLMTEEEKQQNEINEMISRVKKLQKNNKSAIDSLFDEWRSKNFMKNNIDIAKAFEPVIKKEKANGKLTKQYTTIKEILEGHHKNDPEPDDSESGTVNVREEEKPDDGSRKKLEKIIQKGWYTKKEKNKILKKYKKTYPGLCSEIKKLPIKK